jgi:hypothetical protein
MRRLHPAAESSQVTILLCQRVHLLGLLMRHFVGRASLVVSVEVGGTRAGLKGPPGDTAGVTGAFPAR